jgi:stage II sporulation protein E
VLGIQLRQRITQIKTELPERGAATLARKDRTRAIECITRFILGFILSGAQIFEGISPFAVGFAAASGAGMPGIFAMVGASLGYLMGGTFFWAIKYICMVVIVCTGAIVFRETEMYRSNWFMPAVAAFIAACIGFVSAADAGWTLSATALLLTDTVLAGGCAYFYRIALSPWSGRLNFEYGAEISHTVSVLILLSTILISLAGVKVFGIISIGRAAASLVVFLAAYKGGVGLGCASGVAVGLAMDAAAAGAPIFCMAYGMSGLVAGIFSKLNRFIFALSFIMVDALVAALSMNNPAVPAILYEVFIASVVFMVLPGAFMSKLSVLLPMNGSGLGVLKAREYTKTRVDQAALAFRELYETVRTAVGEDKNDNDIACVFDKAADVTCRKCAKTSKCWHVEYQTTLDAMNNATPVMMKRGKLLETDLPGYFTGSCLNLPQFVAAVNNELRALTYRRQYKKRLKENQSAAFNQYSDISAILNDISEELGNGMGFEPELENRLRKFMQSVSIQADTAVFRDCGGRLHAEISGAGLDAFRKTPEYLEKLSAVLSVRLCTAEAGNKPDRLILLEAEPLAATVGISCLKKQEKEISGDRGAYFKTDEGILYVILSDGMGSGEEAAKYSSDAVRILERFLRSGVSPETAVRMLNDLMLLKNADDTGCATVDLVCINLFTGLTRMFKYGAAPSYLKHGGSVRRIKGKSLAAGLGAPPHDSPDQLKMELKAGSVAVIVSDGVTSSLDDDWLCDMIAKYDGTNPRELARDILEAASAKFGAEDDMTVFAIQVTDRL